MSLFPTAEERERVRKRREADWIIDEYTRRILARAARENRPVRLDDLDSQVEESKPEETAKVKTWHDLPRML
jgi:endonuclease III-like uncharacterized protein